MIWDDPVRFIVSCFGRAFSCCGRVLLAILFAIKRVLKSPANPVDERESGPSQKARNVWTRIVSWGGIIGGTASRGKLAITWPAHPLGPLPHNWLPERKLGVNWDNQTGGKESVRAIEGDSSVAVSPSATIYR